MTFRDVAVKNFRVHMKRYLSYFLCSSFSIMIFFMYSTIFFNDKLNKSSQVSKGVLDALVLPTAALIIFSVIFISYAHSAFIKSRQQEFGLFMSLGMSIKQIARIIIFENGLVGITSIFTGIISGAVFSRIFFLIVLKVLQVNGIEFSIPIKSFTVTFGAFTAIFLIAILLSLITAYRFQPVQLLKSKKVAQRNQMSNPLLALIGIILMVGSIVMLCIKFASESSVDTGFLVALTASCLVGVYITISQIGGVLIKLTKKQRLIYYKNIRLITGLDYRFRQTKKIIFITTIMVMVTTFYCGIMFYFLSTAEKMAFENNPYHAAYIQFADKGDIPKERLNAILSSGDTELTEHKTLEVMNLKYIYSDIEQRPIGVISVDKLNELTGSNFNVKQGCYIRLEQVNEKSNEEKNDARSKDIILKAGILNNKVRFQEVVYKVCFNNFKYNYSSVFLLNNEDYMALKSSTDLSKLEVIHFMNFKDWHKSGTIVDKLNEELKNSNKSITNNADNRNVGMAEELFQCVSTLEEYTYQKQGGSLMLFISGFLGLFFFIAASVILSFRLFSEMDEEKAKYKKLCNIGIRDKEIKKTIYQELRLIFFIPVFLGSALSLMFLYAFTRDGGQNSLAAIKHNLMISSIYFLFQLCYYFIIRKTYCDKIIESTVV